MKKTPEQLISDAYIRFTGKNPNESITPAEYAQGFSILSDIIATFDDDYQLIPYQSNIYFNILNNTDTYIFTLEDLPFVPTPNMVVVKSEPLVEVDFVNLLFGAVWTPIRVVSKEEFYNRTRPFNLSFPFQVVFDKQLTYSTLTFYPVNNRNYQALVIATVELGDLQRYSNIAIFPTSDYMYLKYRLGYELSGILKTYEWTAADENMKIQLEKNVRSSSIKSIAVRPYDIVGRRWYGYREFYGFYQSP